MLQQLEDEGLVEFERVDGRKTATLTSAGREHVEEHREQLGSPWDDARGPDGDPTREAGVALKNFILSWRQVMHTGTPAQQAKATATLDDARKAMYRILAEDD